MFFTYIYLVFAVDGMCTLSSATYTVGFRVGACPSYAIVDALAGWSRGGSIVISEVQLTDNNGE